MPFVDSLHADPPISVKVKKTRLRVKSIGFSLYRGWILWMNFFILPVQATNLIIMQIHHFAFLLFANN